MHDERAGIEPQQNVFRAALDAPDDFALDFSFESARDGPAQAAVANDQRSDAPADERRGDAPARRFYFGQLGQ